jgi:hypothetical protein
MSAVCDGKDSPPSGSLVSEAPMPLERDCEERAPLSQSPFAFDDPSTCYVCLGSHANGRMVGGICSCKGDYILHLKCQHSLLAHGFTGAMHCRVARTTTYCLHA